MVILNHNGQVLASTPNDTNSMQKLFWNPQSQAIVQAALKSPQGTARVHVLDGQTLIALPIKGLGVFFTWYLFWYVGVAQYPAALAPDYSGGGCLEPGRL